MIMTINSIYKQTLEQISKNEHRLDIMVAFKLKSLANEMNLKDDAQGLVDMHNTLIKLDGIIKKANELYLSNSAEN